jgi:hypothetical protein
MLVQIGGEYLDPGMVEYVFEDADVSAGATCQWRGEPGYVRLDAEDGRPVLVNARFVVAVRSKDGLSEIETSRGQLLLVEGQPGAVAGFLNKVRRIGMVA